MIFERFLFPNFNFPKILRIILNLFVIFNLWVIFRCPSVSSAIIFYKKLYSLEWINFSSSYLAILVLFIGMIIHYFDQRQKIISRVNKISLYILIPFWIIIILSGLLISQESYVIG